jgi:multiple sugar transport system permease protein
MTATTGQPAPVVPTATADPAPARLRHRSRRLAPRTRRRLVSASLTALTYLVLIVMLAPVVYLILASTQNAGALASGHYNLLAPSFSAFSKMWSSVEFSKYLTNSLIICGASAALATAIASCAGYALARLPFRGSKVFDLSVIGTQLIPGSMFLLPLFMGFIWLKQATPVNLIDSRVGMILVYTAFFTPVAIYLLRSFFLAIPGELEEAALVDGCTPMGAFWRVVLPTAAPGLVATFAYAFLFAWDELLFVSALTQNQAETIPIGIRNFIGNYSGAYDQLMAAGVVSTIPVMIAFFLTQRWLVKGLTAGAVKG